MARRKIKAFGSSPAVHQRHVRQDTPRVKSVLRQGARALARGDCRTAFSYAALAATYGGRIYANAEASIPESGALDRRSARALRIAGRVETRRIRAFFNRFTSKCLR